MARKHETDEQRPRIRNSTADFLIFTGQDGTDSIEVRHEEQTIWLSQKLMGELFGVDVRTVSEHLGNIYEQGELTREATLRKLRIAAADEKEGAKMQGGMEMAPGMR